MKKLQGARMGKKAGPGQQRETRSDRGGGVFTTEGGVKGRILSTRE